MSAANHGGVSYSLAEIQARLGGEILGDSTVRVSQVATLASATQGQISFLTNPKYRKQLADTQASAVILAPAAVEEAKVVDGLPLALLVTSNPYAYFARVAQLLNPVAHYAGGISPMASVQSELTASVSVAPTAVIGKDVEIGEGSVIQAGVVIGDGAKLGRHCLVYPNVTIYSGCRIGDNCILHSGAVIGADGFGFAPEGGKWVKIPQIGVVVIGNDVEIGANTSIDRGALEDTVIGDGCKLDNQIQIGHNCKIGAHTVIAGCVGIAGSTKVGKGCAFGGAAMILGHLEIADGTVISPGSMVMKSINKPGKYTALFPLEEHDRWLHNAAQIRHLSRLADRVAELEKKLEQNKSED